MSGFLDISPLLTPSTAVFPGDTPLSRRVALDLDRADPITLSSLHTTVHIGAHADAPSHYGRGAPTIDRMPLRHYIGPCVVVHAPAPRRARITPSDLADALAETPEPRVLIRTGTQPDKQVFNNDFAALHPDLIDALADRGVITVGVDTPSVDPADSKDLPAHRACLRRNLAILEGLVLDHVPPGRYELIALPLRLQGFDASPVRAVLRPL